MKIFFCSSSSDDDPLSGRIISNIKSELKRHDQVKVDEVCSCEEALELISRNNDYDSFVINVNSESCFSNGLSNLLGKQNNKEKLIFSFVESFNPKYAANLVFLDHEEKCVYIRRGSLTSNQTENLSKVINTITKKPSIYISYGNDKKGRSRNIIRQLELSLNKALPYLKVKYDKNSLEIGDSVSTFINELTSSTRLIVIINDKYLKSEYGMEELIEIYKKLESEPEEVKKNIFPIMSNILYFKNSDLYPIKRYWKKEKKKLEDLGDDYEDEIKGVDDILRFIPKIPDFLGNFYTLPAGTLAGDNFSPLIWAIYQKSLSEYIRHYENEGEVEKVLRVMKR